MAADWSDAPFQVAVYDKAMKRVGWVGGPVSLVVVLRHNAPSTAALTLQSDHRRVASLAAKGARVSIKYRGTVVLTGMVRMRQGKGPKSTGTVTFQVVDDWRLFTRVQGWPVPGSAVTAQGEATVVDRRTGNAETVVHGFVQANAVTRLGLPVTLGTNLNRGATITVTSRFHPLADRLFPKVDAAGLGVTVRQAGPEEQGAGLRVDCYAPATYPRTLTEASGVVQEWEWTDADPDVTRVVAEVSGADDARSHRLTVGTTRETTWGDLIEGHLKVSDVRTSDVGWEAAADAQAQEALTEGAPRAGLALKLAETRTFRYDPTGTSGVRVGDVVRVEVGPGVVVEDVLREATLGWTAADGLTVIPQVGERRDDPSRSLVRAVASLARAFRNTTRLT